MFIIAHAAHQVLASQAFSMESDTSSDEEDDIAYFLLLQEGLKPGKGVSLYGDKAMYERNTTCYYQMCRSHHNSNIFDGACGLTTKEFDTLHDVCKVYLYRRMDPRLELTEEEAAQAGRVNSRAFSSEEQLFLFLTMLRGGNEGSLGLNVLERDFGVSRGTISNTFYHVLGAVYSALKSLSQPLISWPSEAERRSMRGLINGFPQVVAFVDGSKQRAWRPVDDVEQEYIFDGHHHFHAYTVLFWCDVYGQCIRLDFTLKGSMQDRGMFNMTAVGRKPDHFFHATPLGNSLRLSWLTLGSKEMVPLKHRTKKGKLTDFVTSPHGTRTSESREYATSGVSVE